MSTTFTSWDSELYHHGIKGQKWGVRRYQNADGTLTAEGKAKYGVGGTATAKERAKFLNKLDQQRAHNTVRIQELSKSKRASSKNSIAEYNKTNRATANTIKSVLDAAKKNNMNIKSKQVTRHVQTGRTIAASIATSVALSAALTAVASYGSGGVRTHVHYANGPSYSYVTPAVLKLRGTGVVFGKKARGTKYKAERSKYN